MEIKLPNFMWFKNCMRNLTKEKPGGNTFTGSCGTDPSRGSIHKKIFNFKILMTKYEDGSVFFDVDSYVTQPWKPGVGIEKTDFDSRKFDGVEESIEEIREFLMERAAQLI